MGEYGLYAFCNECGKNHPMGQHIEIVDGPVEKEPLAAVFQNNKLPSSVEEAINGQIICPSVHRMTCQRDVNQIFLVPIKGL
jgi:hypothetical protein